MLHKKDNSLIAPLTGRRFLQTRLNTGLRNNPAAETNLLELTYKVGEQHSEQYGGGDGGHGGTFPAAVLGRLLELEGAPGEGVPWQQAWRGRVDGTPGEGVARRGAAEQRSASRRSLKQEVPA